MSEQRLSISIRMTRDLLDRLKDAADARSHSMNAEIVQRLEGTLSSSRSINIGGNRSKSSNLQEEEDGALISLWHELNPKQRSAVIALIEHLVEPDLF